MNKDTREMHCSHVLFDKMSNTNASVMQLLEYPQSKFSIERYKSLRFRNIIGFPNNIPNDIRKHLPKFIGKKSKSNSKHLNAFIDIIGHFEINHEDVVMKLFT